MCTALPLDQDEEHAVAYMSLCALIVFKACCHCEHAGAHLSAHGTTAITTAITTADTTGDTTTAHKTACA
jgi:hypothetical protein